MGINMPYMEIYNVKHGDFGVYYDLEKDYACVIDCGTSQPNDLLKLSLMTPKDIIASVARNLGKFNKRDILITHLHEDHYNGIAAFRRSKEPFFRNMFIPYIDPKQDYTKTMFLAMELLDMFSTFFKVPFTVLKNFKELFSGKYSKDVIPIYQGVILDDISSERGNAQVLWPPMFKGDSKKLKYTVDRFKKTLEEHNLSKIIDIAEEKFYSDMEYLSLSLREYSNFIHNKYHFDTYNIESVELNYIDKYIEGEELGEISEFKDEDELILSKLKKRGIEKAEAQEAIIRSYWKLKKQLKNILDALSIVFHIDHDIILFGDITERILYLLNKDIHDEYKVIKLPHHGTRDISFLNTKADCFVVSISDGRKYKPIDIRNIKKALKDRSIILCTDGHRICILRYLCKFCCATNLVIKLHL